MVNYLKFKLVEEVNILENVRQNIKKQMCKELNLDAETKYVLHHIHDEKYTPSDDQAVASYKDKENCVLIPRTTSTGNDVHHLIHFLAQHEHELDKIKGYSVKDGKPIEYSLRELVNILRGDTNI